MRRCLRKPSPALVVASLALFVALSGAGVAAHLAVRSSDIVDNTIRSEDVVDNSRLSLGGSDIREATLEGLVKGKGSVRFARRQLEVNTEGLIVRLPGIGRLSGGCGTEGFSSGYRTLFVAEAGRSVAGWRQLSPGTTEYHPQMQAAGTAYTTVTRFETYHFATTDGPPVRATVFLAGQPGPPCFVQATALLSQ